ncbi:hypothetical protein ONZ45_g1857 [Pleurotus djamor]|nr:hypothetical protein ONZ45_g1857 [Pleurotus djamor]
MSHYSRYGNRQSANRQSAAQLNRQPSVVSNVSGIADSTISFGTLVTGESLQLSQFPQPPRYTPLSPIQSEVGSMSSRRMDDGRSVYSMATSYASERDRGSPLAQSPIPPVPPLPSQAGSSRRPADATSIKTSRTFSPYDWHEGASSIDMDVAEDRLPTSFITQLLRDNPEPRNRHLSVHSDAFSGISELTYPPPLHRGSGQPLPRSLPPRPTGARPSPASSQIARAGSTSDSDTLITSLDEYSRSASRSTQGRPAPPSSYLSGKARAWDEHSEDDKSLHDLKSTAPDGMMTIDEDPPPPSFPEARRAHGGNRKSISTRSFVSSLISRAPSTSSRSVRSFRRAFDWMRKPLPPVPDIPSKFVVPKHQEEDLPLPELINRADTLSNLLEKGHHPHRSLTSSFFTRQDADQHPHGLSSAFDDHGHGPEMSFARRHGSRKTMVDNFNAPPEEPPSSSFLPFTRRTRILVCLAIVVIAAVGIAVGVALSRNRASSPSCEGNLTGRACNLDASCVCTDSSESCLPLARHLVDMVPSLNENFKTNYTSRSLALSLFYALGSPSNGANCANQALQVDVAFSIPSTQATRASWAQAALLWNLVESGDVEGNNRLRDFAVKAPWKELDSGGSDTSAFTIASSGFLFDFAEQTAAPQKTLSFDDSTSLSSTQKSRVGGVAQNALGRMYTFASASSAQKSKALETYWRSVLQQQASDLPVFLSAISTAPVLLPFNGDRSGAQNVIPLLRDAPSFPPPISCFPNLTAAQRENIDSLETSVFNLPSSTSTSSFQTSCFPDRPVYGVLDLLQLRLPFIDSRTGVAKQAVSLKRDAYSRSVLYTNEALAALPSTDGVSPIRNPLYYGTFNENNFKHVVLSYLSSISDQNDARALIRFVLTRVATPPTSAQPVLEALSRLPSIEVAVFGSITVEDMDSVVSPFSNPNQSLFFGSQQASEMRQTVINAGSRVVWTVNATSPMVVRDSTLTDPDINQTFAAAATNESATVDDVITALMRTGKFSQ